MGRTLSGPKKTGALTYDSPMWIIVVYVVVHIVHIAHIVRNSLHKSDIVYMVTLWT